MKDKDGLDEIIEKYRGVNFIKTNIPLIPAIVEAISASGHELAYFEYVEEEDHSKRIVITVTDLPRMISADES